MRGDPAEEGLVNVTSDPKASKGTWLPTSGPRTLALLRIVTGAVAVLIANSLRHFEVPPELLRVPPRGTAWLDFLPVSDGLYDSALVVFGLASLLVALGWRPSWTSTIAALAFFYLGWVTTLTGKVDHTHHLLWVLVVLAVSPCANKWAIRLEHRRGSYQWPAMAVIVLIGLIYFGAGLQKVLTSGLEWGWSDNLTNTVLNQAWEKSRSAPIWLIDHPLVGRTLGTAALFFELLFLPLLLYPRTRKWVWPAGLLFHWGTWLILGISFVSLQVMYVVFLPLDGTGDSAPPTDTQRRVLAALVAIVMVFSLSGVELAWPVAAYPGFEGISDHYATDYEVIVDGEVAFLTDVTPGIPPWHVVPLITLNVQACRASDVLEWLGIDEMYKVTVDTSTGRVVGRTALSALTC